MNLDTFLDHQTAAIGWLYLHGRQAVLSTKPDNTPPMVGLDTSSWRQGPGASWILETPEGELLWVAGDDDDYRREFVEFAAQQGLADWSGRDWHVDHLVSRAVQRRRYPTGYARDLHVLVLTAARHNGAWSSWERRNLRHNNVFDLWLVAKARGHRPLLKRRASGRAERWLKGVHSVAPEVAAAVELRGLISGITIQFPDTPRGRLVDLMLGRARRDSRSPVEVAEHVLLEEVVETWLPDRVPMASTADSRKLARSTRRLRMEYERLTNEASDFNRRASPPGRWQVVPAPSDDDAIEMYGTVVWLPE